MTTVAPVVQAMQHDGINEGLLHQVFASRVAEDSARVAISSGEASISYGSLNARANRLAHALRQSGVGSEAHVALIARPGIDLIVGMLGILKSGGAYVPLGVDFPLSRVNFLLQDSDATAVVTDGSANHLLHEWAGPVIVIGEEQSQTAAPVDQAPEGMDDGGGRAAYLLYTSGSTGTPKGVVVEHHSVVRLFDRTEPWFHFDGQDVWSLLHAASFDFSVWEIWGALLYGGRLVIPPENVRRSPAAVVALLKAEKVTVLNQTPSAFQQLLAAELAQPKAEATALRLIIFGGERLDPGLLRPWMERWGDQQPALINMYGITETTVHVTYKRIVRADLESTLAHSPIGIPIPDLEVCLLDDAQCLVDDGVAGEIYVTGPGVARGYWNRPALTASQFMTVSGLRMYRSGDLAIRLDGQLYYLGRKDGQIKVRGYRIEPAEIEGCLCQNTRVAGAVAVASDYGEGDTRLEAYIVPAAGLELSSGNVDRFTLDLTEWAKRELRPHQRPSAYRFISYLPMTENGKADREAVRSMACLRAHTAEQRDAAVALSPTQQTVLEIAESVLWRRGFGLTDDLFDIGATSLALTRILLQINQRLGVSLTGLELVDEASVSAMAACADAQREGRLNPVASEMKK